MSATSVAEKSQTPLVLSQLPNFNLGNQPCPPHVSEHLDQLLIAIEALELGGAEKILTVAKQLELDSIIKNRVILWQLRVTNPWRRAHTRKAMTMDQAKALIVIISHLARQLTVKIRQLISAELEMRSRHLPVQNHFQLFTYLDHFEAYFCSRMNIRRTKIDAYLESSEDLDELALKLLNQLLFCTGTHGVKRLWISLFDGEVS
jgi:hypothetical protein